MQYTLAQVFLLFIICSAFGWLVETLAILIATKKLTNRGFLIGPYCPIYGVGALIIVFLLSQYKNDPLNLYISFVIYASILEYFTSYLMEKLFNARWWDYSKNKFNLNGRICLLNSLSFGVLGILFVYFINPFLITMLVKIPDNIILVISSIIFVIFIADISVTFNILTKLKKSVKLLNKDMTDDINKQITAFIENNRFVKAFPDLKAKIYNIKTNMSNQKR